MSIAAAGLVLAFLLATGYAAAFHLLVGGSASQLLLYLLASWIGFIAGHLLGDWLGLTLFRLGAVQLLSASLLAWLFLLGSRWLWGRSAPDS